MVITAMYLYGVMSDAFEFSLWWGLLGFVMDVILASCVAGD